MATQARVSSTEALESLRAALIVFVGKGRRALGDVGDEVRRTRQWLQFDQRASWEGEVRRRTKALQQAQQELASVRFAGHQESATMARQAAVNRAQRALSEAEDKRKKVKGWSQNFDHAVDPVYKRIGGLQHVLDHDLPKAIIYLASIQRTLAEYAKTSVATDATDFAATFARPGAPGEAPVEAEAGAATTNPADDAAGEPAPPEADSPATSADAERAASTPAEAEHLP